MANCHTSLLTWTSENDMQLNTSKTKEMLLGRLNPVNTPLLSTPVSTVQRVDTFKLLGVHLDANLTWTGHVSTIVSRANKRLFP